ncbi:MAG: OmpA family protein [Gammaproteobacteria bacterium]|nr:OmpA family protein [Gammaproteobacteria bacterium]
MKKTKLLFGLLSAGLLAASFNAHANHRGGATFATLANGYNFFASKRSLNNASAPTVQFGYDFTDKWAAEIGVSVINSNKKVTEEHAHGYIYSLDGIYRTDMHGNFAPYLLAGLGVTGLDPNGTDPVNQAHAELGIGSQFFISDSIALGAEAKDLYTFSGGKNDIQLLATISFLFGGSPAALDYGIWKGDKSVSHNVA